MNGMKIMQILDEFKSGKILSEWEASLQLIIEGCSPEEVKKLLEKAKEAVYVQIFYVVTNEKKFLTHYEDGEGNDYYSMVDFSKVWDGGIFPDRKTAENHRRWARNLRYRCGYTLEEIEACSIQEIKLIKNWRKQNDRF